MSAKPKAPAPEQAGAPPHSTSRFIVVHGDKGGVGKSFVAQAIADYLASSDQPVAIVDADTANPDVSRMFAAHVPCQIANVRSENGWMDVMDFVLKHPGYTIIMNTPAGVGDFMKADMASFTEFLRDQEVPMEMELWWTMNIQHDSVNLLDQAYKAYGQHFDRIRVVCNTHFSNGDKSLDGPFLLWNESPLRQRIERSNGMTLFFPGLHVRVVQKIFAPRETTPFYHAEDASLGETVGLEHSERWKLVQWRKEVKKLFEPALSVTGASSTAAV